MSCAAVLLVFACLAFALAGCEGGASDRFGRPREEWSQISRRIERPIRGRLSSGSLYRACAADQGTCGPLPAPTSMEFTEAARLIARLARDSALDAERLHVEALARIAVAGVQSAEALRRLEAAAALAPADRRIANDLLAVRHARLRSAEVDDRAQWTGARRSLRAVSDALRLAASDPEEPEVWFNYALVFEAVGLSSTAREGWRRFLALEPESPWAHEVRRLLLSRAAAKQTVPPPPETADELMAWGEAHPLPARAYVEGTLLAAWARDPRSEGGPRLLELAGALAEVVERRFHDSTVATTLDLVATAPLSRQEGWARAIELFFQGVSARDEQRYGEALPLLTAARSGLEGVPFQGWASYRIADCLYGLHRNDEAAAVLRGMAVDRERQQMLEARRLWLLGLVENRRGALRDSVTIEEQALELLLASPDLPAIASIHVNLAAPLDLLSEHDRAWHHRLHALRASEEVSVHRLRHIALFDAATELVAAGDPATALPFLVELWSNAVAWDAAVDLPGARLEAARLQASALSALERYSAASDWLEEAARAAAEMQDAQLVARLNADLAVERAEILVASDPARALADLDAALGLYRRIELLYPLVRIHRLRGEAAESLGLPHLATESYVAAVNEHEQILASLERPADRAGYLAHAAAAYDALIRHLAIDKGDPEAAFDVLERSRRVWSAAGASIGQTLSELRSRLPSDAALVAYRSLETELLVWYVRSSGTELLVLPMAREELNADILRHETEMWVSQALPQTGSATAKLSERLIGPLGSRLAPLRRLAILPDGNLDRVAFSALVDPLSGEALIDSLDSLTQLVSTQPSVAPPRPPAHQGIVAVGDPAFDPGAFPGLERLPAAEREAREVASIYADSVVLLGSAAQAATIETALGGRRALHYAGHAVAEPEPARSGLVLAPAAGDDGLLTVAELDSRSVAGLDLVVLSACRTTGGERPASEDWAEALLGMGVRGVVANRWQVEDGSAHRFVLTFHRHRHEGLDDAEALAAAQRDFRNEPPRVWAGFSYYGTF